MATVTLRPNGNATNDAPVIDNSDATYKEINAPQYGGDFWSWTFNAAPTVPAGGQIRSLTPRLRLRTTGITQPADQRFVLGTTAGNYSNETLPNTASAITTQAFTTRSARPDGSTFASAGWFYTFNLYFYNSQPTTVNLRIYEAYLDVLYNEAPVATPAASYTAATSRPTVSWTYTDAEADAQERFKVRVFTAAQYGAGDFDPLTSVATAESGEITSAATSWVLTSDLPPAVYRAYVWVADAGSGGRYSTANAYQQITVAFTAPSAPTVVATGEDHRVVLSLTGATYTANSTTHPRRYEVERSYDAGATWETVRALVDTGDSWTQTINVDAPDGSAQTAYDYEAIRDASVLYRARVFVTVLGSRYVSDWSATDDAIATGTGWVLKNPLNPDQNISVNVEGDTLTMTSVEDQTAFYPLGREKAVVVAGEIHGEQMNLTLLFESEAAFQTFETIRRAQATLLIQSPVEHLWVRFGATRTKTRKWSEWRRVTIPVIEVESPAVEG